MLPESRQLRARVYWDNPSVNIPVTWRWWLGLLQLNRTLVKLSPERNAELTLQRCRVKEITIWKRTTSLSMHEYVVMDIWDYQGGGEGVQVGALLCERGRQATVIKPKDKTIMANLAASLASSVASSVASSASLIGGEASVAEDRVWVFNLRDSKTGRHPVRQQKNDRRLWYCQFPDDRGPLLSDVAAAISVVSEASPYYHIFKNQCFYFAGMVFAVVGIAVGALGYFFAQEICELFMPTLIPTAPQGSALYLTQIEKLAQTAGLARIMFPSMAFADSYSPH